jgi:hypothetical protein
MNTYEIGERVAIMAGPLRHLTPNTGTVIPFEGPAKPGAVRILLDATGGPQTVSLTRVYSESEDF